MTTQKRIHLLTNYEIAKLAETMPINALVAEVHKTQPGLTRSAIKRIIAAHKKAMVKPKGNK